MTDSHYRLRCLTRCRVDGIRLVPGALLLIPNDKLRVAAHLTRCGTTKPDDERTRLDVELFELLREAVPA